jgi:hypothetical protein
MCKDRDLIELLGFIKNAEMELSEAAFKAGDGELGVAGKCLDVAETAIGEARFIISRRVTNG